MIHRRYLPRAPLSDFIELLWLFERPTPSHGRERLLPTGTVELVINLGDSRVDRFEALVVGPHSRFFELDTSRPTSVIGAHFKPGGMFAFLDEPIDELHNCHVPLAALWGGRVAEMRERLLAADGAEARLRLFERLLLTQLDRRRNGHGAVNHALAQFSCGRRRIGDVVEDTGLSPRRFIRLFSDQVGLTPKAFCRVRRFQGAVARLHGLQEVDWADTALACGYADQSHMIHDFKDFAGLSPARYLARQGQHMNHVPL
jgi:AraC-like DNA-binding protein